jgi:hypothetical protein
MPRKFSLFFALAAVSLLAAGCSQRAPLGEESAAPVDTNALAKLSAPLDLNQFEVVASGGGYRGVFLKLSRFPDAIAATDRGNPAQIILDISGPTGAETPEETFPGGDTLVSRVRVTREIGLLRVVLDLAATSPPKYSVHQMGDWVMVRLAAAQ